ncbi:MAG: 4-hydroxythreonine-4-phosphate dehydrogenase PdxA [Candidatus Hydrogenedentes bacterium]|nr:4-hydroxythreonine-4-phosphate dehydrogenase PdxA [Candidatus Hydrogenedentota bacterium]
MTSAPKPVIAITMGDINGIGPEILAKALASRQIFAHCIPLVLGSHSALEAQRALAPALPSATVVERSALNAPLHEDRLYLCEAMQQTPQLRPGVPDPAAGACAVAWIEEAVRLCQAGIASAMTTCPISKDVIYQAGCKHTGHTEIVASMTGVEDYRMCLFADDMRVVHLTGHLSLRDALDAITAERIVSSARIGHNALCKLGLKRKHIAIAGLNPHAGENGAFGTEEATIIAPAVAQCREEGLDCSGPHSPDTIFKRMQEGEFDLVVALYHDQGHIPLKLIAMDLGVNVTLGVPIVRTSVDHGTAFDIAGTGRARENSLIAAIRLAAKLAQA